MKSILTCTLLKLYIAHIFCCMRKYYPELTVANWKHRYGKEGIFNSNNFGCSAWENRADCLRWWIFTVSTGFKALSRYQILTSSANSVLEDCSWGTTVRETLLGGRTWTFIIAFYVRYLKIVLRFNCIEEVTISKSQNFVKSGYSFHQVSLPRLARELPPGNAQWGIAGVWDEHAVSSAACAATPVPSLPQCCLHIQKTTEVLLQSIKK